MIIISQIVFILSVLGILFLIFRRIPDLLEFPRRSEEKSPVYNAMREQYKKIKEKADTSEFLHDTVIPRTEKILRRTKIIVLKFDNFLAKKTNKLRQRIRKREKENGENNKLPR